MSTVFFASFIGVGALSASVAWAESANPAMLSSDIGEDIKME